MDFLCCAGNERLQALFRGVRVHFGRNSKNATQTWPKTIQVLNAGNGAGGGRLSHFCEMVQAALSRTEMRRRSRAAAAIDARNAARTALYDVSALDATCRAALAGSLQLRGVCLHGPKFRHKLAHLDEYNAMQDAVLRGAGFGGRNRWQRGGKVRTPMVMARLSIWEGSSFQPGQGSRFGHTKRMKHWAIEVLTFAQGWQPAAIQLLTTYREGNLLDIFRKLHAARVGSVDAVLRAAGFGSRDQWQCGGTIRTPMVMACLSIGEGSSFQPGQGQQCWPLEAVRHWKVEVLSFVQGWIPIPVPLKTTWAAGKVLEIFKNSTLHGSG